MGWELLEDEIGLLGTWWMNGSMSKEGKPRWFPLHSLLCPTSVTWTVQD